MDLNKIKRFFTHEWQSKLISLLLAASFWFYVTYFENKTDYNLSIPVKFENLPPESIVVYSSLKNAFITLPLRKDQKQTVDFNKSIKARVDLSQAKQGGGIYKIELLYDKNLKIKPRLKQESVNVIIDKKISKTVDLRQKLTGAPADGYYVEEVILEDNSVNISGPGQRIETINYLETAPIDLSGASNNLQLKIKINNPENTLLLKKRYVNINIIIKEILVEKEIIIPISINHLSDKFSVARTPGVKLKISIPGRYLKNISNHIRLSVDAGTISKPGNYSLSLTADYNDQIKLLEIPESIKVQILQK